MTCVAATMLLTCFDSAQAEKQWLFIASPAKPAVIYRCLLDTETGEFGELQVAEDNISTGFMALHPTQNKLYAGTREKVAKGMPNGFVQVFDIDTKQGKLSALGSYRKASTGDSGTTHIEVSPTGYSVLVCHYGGEGTSAIPVGENGGLIDTVSKIKHTGSGADPRRQKRPHPHGVAISQNGNFVCVADLGNDHIEVFRISAKAELSKCSRWQSAPGAGPRHVSFHPNGKWLYCINELDNTLVTLDFDAKNGTLKETQTVDTLPDDYRGVSYTAEIAIHPNGKFLYGSNRGHNSTVVCRINQNNGKLKVVQHEPTQGDHPRFVGIDPTGKIYLAANMNDNNVVSFFVDQKTGKLKPTGNILKVARPMCILFVRQK